MGGNYWKYSVLVGTIFFVQGVVCGQSIHLKSHPLDGQAEPTHVGIRRNSPVHQIIEFDHQPGVGDLDALLAAGFRIVGAIPDNAVVVLAPGPGPNAVPAQIGGIRSVGEMAASDKLSEELGRQAKKQTEALEAIVEFHPDVDMDAQQAIAAAESVTFVRPAFLLSNHAIVAASPSKLIALAAHDEVAYIFPAKPALLVAPTAGNAIMPCAGMLTLAGPIGQYANIVQGWDLDSGGAAHLGYVFGPLTTKVPAATVESEILRAFNAWSAVTNVIFEPASSATAARTIYLKFASGAHGDPYPFDSTGATLAHTFYPVPLNGESIAGDIHLDADENWHAGGDVDIYTVALHEIGHALGLAHSDNPDDVMYPYYQRGVQLSPRDIGAIQALYGVPANSLQNNLSGSINPPAPGSTLALTMNPAGAPGNAAEMTIGGSVSGGVPPLALQYQTDHGYSGKIAQVNDGTWSEPGVALVTGANNITVTAFDSANHMASQSESVTRAATPPSTATAPLSILISSPSSAVTTAHGTTVSVAGTAAGGTGITQVTWQTSAGSAGVAIGTGEWLASNIPLLTGTNTIVVRAFDAGGASAWAAVVEVRQ